MHPLSDSDEELTVRCNLVNPMRFTPRMSNLNTSAVMPSSPGSLSYVAYRSSAIFSSALLQESQRGNKVSSIATVNMS